LFDDRENWVDVVYPKINDNHTKPENEVVVLLSQVDPNGKIEEGKDGSDEHGA